MLCLEASVGVKTSRPLGKKSQVDSPQKIDKLAQFDESGGSYAKVTTWSRLGERRIRKQTTQLTSTFSPKVKLNLSSTTTMATKNLYHRSATVYNFFIREVELALKATGSPISPSSSSASSAPPSESHSESTPLALPNPFIPRRSDVSGRWIPPRYSLRRQADLYNEAKEDGLEGYLPAGPKTHSVNPDGPQSVGNLPPFVWVGEPKEKISKGLYGGRRTMFKGHKWERELAERERGKKERREERLCVFLLFYPVLSCEFY